MTQKRAIRKLLANNQAHRVPDDLRNKLIADIPEDLPSAPTAAAELKSDRSAIFHLRPAAAILILTITGVLAGYGIGKHLPLKNLFSTAPVLSHAATDSDTGTSPAEGRQITVPVSSDYARLAAPAFHAFGDEAAPRTAFTGENPSFCAASLNPRSTFDLAIDPGSYYRVKHFIESGNIPPAKFIRAEELINHFDPVEAPSNQEPLVLITEGSSSPFHDDPGYRLIRINIRAQEEAPSLSHSGNVQIIVDLERGENRERQMQIFAGAIPGVIDKLSPEKQLEIILPGAEHTGQERGEKRIRKFIMDEEMKEITLTENSPPSDKASQQRVLMKQMIVLTDETTRDHLTSSECEHSIQEKEIEVIALDSHDTHGFVWVQKGAPADLPDLSEVEFNLAKKVLVRDLMSQLSTVATQASVEVRFEPDSVEMYRFIGADPSPDAPEPMKHRTFVRDIPAGHNVTALYEIKLKKSPPGKSPLAVVSLRYRPAGDPAKVIHVEREIYPADLETKWEEAAPRLQFAVVVAEYASALESPGLLTADHLDKVLIHAQKLSTSMPSESRVDEFIHLVDVTRHIQLTRSDALSKGKQ